MMLQKTDWGVISWIEDYKNSEGIHAGIVTLKAGAHQPSHIHYEEQVIYVLEGQARCLLDGEESILSAGDFFHWRSGVEHEIFNIGSKPFRHLLVSNPDTENKEETILLHSVSQSEVSPDLIYIATEAIRTQFLETLHYGYAIFDYHGNLILQSTYYPKYCVECCQPAHHQGQCLCMRRISLQECGEKHIFQCEYGMEVFQYPIIFGNTLLGYIQSGYVRHASSQKGKIESVYDSPESAVDGMKALLHRIVKAIRNFCEFEQFRRTLMEKELHIASQEETQRILLKNLHETQSAVTDLRINNHFLFNTLNSMASMALDGGSMPLYQSIVDLSKLFHYTLRTQTSMVPFEKEIEYVKAYLQLQKLRYGEDLKILYQLEDALVKTMVPFNFLQPIVENAFIHGFDDSVHKKIKIATFKTGNYMEIQVINSGKKLSEASCANINQSIKSGTLHGLSMLYEKLKRIYEEFTFEIQKGPKGNTCFYIKLPILEASGGGTADD